MICSSVNFDRFMVRSSQWAGLQHQMEELSGVRAIGPWQEKLGGFLQGNTNKPQRERLTLICIYEEQC